MADNKYSHEIEMQEDSDWRAEQGEMGADAWETFCDALREDNPTSCPMSDDELTSFKTVATPEEMERLFFG